MTICIAGICQHEGKPSIAMCCDWQGTYGDFLKSESTYKVKEIGRATTMYAGAPTAARELRATIRPVLEKFMNQPKTPGDFDLRVDAFLAEIRSTVKKKKDEVAEFRAGLKYPVTYKIFCDNGRERMPKTTYEEMKRDIDSLDLDCSLIVGYVDDEEPVLLTILSNGDVIFEENYSCIGSGSDVAMTILKQKQYMDMSLMGCLDLIFNAKNISERTIYVGEAYAFELLIKDFPKRVLTKAGFEYLKDQSLKKIISERHLAFEERFLGDEQ